MEPKANVERIRRYLEVLDEGDEAATLATIDEFFAEDYVAHMAGGTLTGRDALKAHVRGSAELFGKMEHRIEDNFGSGDRVATRVLFRALHCGEFLGMPATGRPIECPIIYVHRFVEGKIQEAWLDWDSVAVLSERLRTPE